MTIHQLRVYTIAEGGRRAFLERFERHSAPIMRRHGFEIAGAWESRREGRDEFVYLLVWPDAPTRDAAWAHFLADDEWVAVKAASRALHGTLVEAIDERTLVAPAPDLG